jgi:hypothetical protein
MKLRFPYRREFTSLTERSSSFQAGPCIMTQIGLELMFTSPSHINTKRERERESRHTLLFHAPLPSRNKMAIRDRMVKLCPELCLLLYGQKQPSANICSLARHSFLLAMISTRMCVTGWLKQDGENGEWGRQWRLWILDELKFIYIF